jgi:hypothetical protein
MNMSNLRILLFLLTIITAFSCKKKNDDNVLGLDVQPENDLVGVTITDSVSIFMHTQKAESLRTYNDRYKYLGSLHDPIFGKTEAGIYTNLSISNNLTNVTFGNNALLDSAELVLRFNDESIGKINDPLNYEVHLLNESILPATAYYTNQTFAYSPSFVNSANGKFANRNGVTCLVIPLNHNMAQYLLQTDANLVNNTVFQAANKGFYIKANNPGVAPNTGSIYRFDLDDDASGVVLYYHNGSSVNSKGESFRFSFSGSNALRVNNITHNYATAYHNLYDQINGAGTVDTFKGNSNVYLNSFGGTRVRVYLPYLKTFSDSQNVSINRAELIIKVDETLAPYDLNYGYPAQLALIGCSSTGVEELVWDQLETTDFVKYNGNYDAANKQYVFNIARQMQKVITHKIENYGFYLVNALPSVASVVRRDNRLRRVVIGGTANAPYKPYFKVTYVKFPHDK